MNEICNRIQIRVILFIVLLFPLTLNAQTLVSDKTQLQNAVAAGGSIQLQNDINIDYELTISKDVVLDLNGKTIKREQSSGDIIGVKCTTGNIVIKNGSIITNQTRGAFGGRGSGLDISGANVTIINCNITGKTSSLSSVAGTAIQYYSGSLQIISGTFSASSALLGKEYAIWSNSENIDKFLEGCLLRKDDNVITSFGKTIEGSVTVSPINYTIKYDPNNGKIISDNYTTAYSILNDTEKRTLPTVEREHYKFIHWFDNSSNDVNENSPITVSTFPYVNLDNKDNQTVTFKAKWEALPYTIHYETDGGEPINDWTYTVENYPESLPTPIRDGYLFSGWFSGNTPITSPSGFTGDITLTSRWSEYKYTLSYITNTETAPSIQSYTKATSGKIAIPATWERKGYIFKGWYDNEKCEGSPITSAPCPQEGKEALVNLSLYAKWEAIAYKLEYTLNDGKFENQPDVTYTIEKTPYILPVPKPTKENSAFKGWYDNPQFSGNPIEIIEKGNIGDKHYYAKWLVTYHAKCKWDSSTHPTLEDKNLSFTKEDEVVLPKWDIIDGYEVLGWHEKGSDELISVIKKGTERDMELYAKWKLAEYKITYETYYGILPDDAVKIYTVESEDIVLPYPSRSGFTFAGWYEEPILTTKIEKVLKGSMGNKTYYAKWMEGNLVVFDKPENGKIVVMNGSTGIKSGEKVGANTKLTVSATPDSPVYKLVKLTINGKDYTSSPQVIDVPADKGLTISAEFVDSRPSVSAPKITTAPVSTDFIPAGESVTVSLTNTDNTATLYYSIDGSTPKLYTQPFLVSSLSVGKTMSIVAYARKNDCKDGITTRNITFGKGRITITFNLPKGVTAINPEGGEVVQAVANGGTFEFKLEVDKNYFDSLEALKVEANGNEILPNALNIYTLTDQTANVTVKVSGITGIIHKVTLSQSAHGHIYFTDDENAGSSVIVNHGDRISVTAVADEGYKFLAWSDNDVTNPHMVTVEEDMTLHASFVNDDPGYLVVLPTLIGAKVKPLTGYFTSVKKGGTFKFYISKESDYSESEPVVYANGEKLTVYKDVYSLYNIAENYVISVDGIRLNKTTLKLADNVIAFNMETAKQITNEALAPTTMVYLLAKSPAGKRFSMWNDGKVDNPRIIAAKDAQQLLPLFVSLPNENLLKVDLPVVPGAGMGAVNANAEALKSGDNIQLKLVILPQYSKSSVKVTANGDVVEPDLALRSSTETKTQFYTLNNVSDNVKVEVSGLELNNYTFSLEQNKGGRISASKTGTVKHGTVVTVTATPDNGNLFLKWSDGNTLNPYPYAVTDNCVLSAQFGNASIPLDNESIQKDGVRIYTKEHTLYIETLKTSNLQVWGFSGQMVYNVSIPEGHSAFYLLSGEYIVKVGDNKPVKVSIR